MSLLTADMDRDGVPDGGDREADTPRGSMVNSFGMGTDTDSDGVYDGIDREPRTAPGNPVDERGVALDGDRVRLAGQAVTVLRGELADAVQLGVIP